MILNNEEKIQRIVIRLRRSITSIDAEKLMKYDSNELGIAKYHVEAIQMLYEECAESLLHNILCIDWRKMATDEFIKNTLDDIKCYGHTYIDEDRQTIELKNGEVIDLSDLDKCDFNHIIDQLREFRG